MKVECILNHVISHSLNDTFGYHVISLNFSSQKMNFFSKYAMNVWYIEILTSNHIHMEDDRHS